MQPALYDAAGDGIGRVRKDDRDRPRLSLDGNGRRGPICHDDVGLWPTNSCASARSRLLSSRPQRRSIRTLRPTVEFRSASACANAETRVFTRGPFSSYAMSIGAQQNRWGYGKANTEVPLQMQLLESDFIDSYRDGVPPSTIRQFKARDNAALAFDFSLHHLWNDLSRLLHTRLHLPSPNHCHASKIDHRLSRAPPSRVCRPAVPEADRNMLAVSGEDLGQHRDSKSEGRSQRKCPPGSDKTPQRIRGRRVHP